MKNLLFICSRNKWRSPTAETLVKNSYTNYNVISAGTSNNAKRQVSLKNIDWADIIFVMEKKHISQLKHKFGQEILDRKKITNLDIADEYEYMDQELVDMLEKSLSNIL